MKSIHNKFIDKLFCSLPHGQTDSEIACEEAARLTSELQEGGDSPDDDDEINYNELPPPPGTATNFPLSPLESCK